jgi:hypothetical protein
MPACTRTGRPHRRTPRLCWQRRAIPTRRRALHALLSIKRVVAHVPQHAPNSPSVFVLISSGLRPHITWAVMAGDADRGPWARSGSRTAEWRRADRGGDRAGWRAGAWVGLPAVSGPWATRGPAGCSMRSVMEQTNFGQENQSLYPRYPPDAATPSVWSMIASVASPLALCQCPIRAFILVATNTASFFVFSNTIYGFKPAGKLR